MGSCRDRGIAPMVFDKGADIRFVQLKVAILPAGCWQIRDGGAGLLRIK